ncbi:MAG: DnaJ C-terminal domain-containing protein, partial [Patescibacteria group bacterium]
LSGKGESGIYGGPTGDLFIRVRIQTHPFFKRDGYDVKSKEEVPLSVLANGGSVDVRTPSGGVRLKIPAHTKSGTSFKLQDKGFERLTSRGRGDQFVTVHATVPTRLSARQKKLLAEFEASLSEQRKSWL